MTLRTKTLLIIGATLFGLVAILYAALQHILVRGYAELEQSVARQNVERALAAITDTRANLDSTAYDWASWDDTYAFMETFNTDYVESNISPSTFAGLRIDFIVYLDTSGEIVFAEGFDPDNEEEIPIPPDLGQYLELLTVEDADGQRTGILPLIENPLLVAARPILTSEDEGPARGTLLMGRYLDAGEIARLANTTYLSLAVYRFNDAYIPEDVKQARAALLQNETIAVLPLDADRVGGYTLIRDIEEMPILVLRTDFPRHIWQQGQRSVSYFLVLLLLAGLVFGVATLLLVERYVLSRLDRLTAEVRSIGRHGDAAGRVSMVGSDELTYLAGNINQMLSSLQRSRAALQRAHDELEQRVRERTQDLARANQDLKREITERARAEATERELRIFTEALSEIIASLTRTPDRDKVLMGILANVWRVVPHDAAHIMLLKEAGVAQIVYHRGYDAHTSEEVLRARRYTISKTPNLQTMMSTRRPIVIPDTRKDPGWVDIPESRWVRSYLGCPIVVGDEVIGFINLDSQVSGFFDKEHAKRLRAFADQAAVALENARLYDEAQRLSTIRERGRLANELHDAVSQMLFSASLMADVLPSIWSRNPEAGRESLGELRRLTRGALAEMRTLLLEMRPHALEEADLSEMVQHLTHAVTGRTGVDVMSEIQLQRTLPVDVRINLYRITQEALNNVVRHAKANRVEVVLREQNGSVILCIRDNGRGFNLADIPAGHLGVGIMHERAETIGAHIHVASQPGQGTEIEVTWQDGL